MHVIFKALKRYNKSVTDWLILIVTKPDSEIWTDNCIFNLEAWTSSWWSWHIGHDGCLQHLGSLRLFFPCSLDLHLSGMQLFLDSNQLPLFLLHRLSVTQQLVWNMQTQLTLRSKSYSSLIQLNPICTFSFAFFILPFIASSQTVDHSVTLGGSAQNDMGRELVPNGLKDPCHKWVKYMACHSFKSMFYWNMPSYGTQCQQLTAWKIDACWVSIRVSGTL